jgi:ABC-type Fe3+-hydroxamate transport system substrate-binding protein
MKTFFLLATGALVLAAGCGQSGSSSSPETNASSNPLTAPVDYLGAVAKAQQLAVKTVDTASINQAIQLFQTEHGRYPQDLDELVKEKFLAKIPAAPYGSKIVYDATTGQVKVVKQ